jgi:hypothetical protein
VKPPWFWQSRERMYRSAAVIVSSPPLSRASARRIASTEVSAS